MNGNFAVDSEPRWLGARNSKGCLKEFAWDAGGTIQRNSSGEKSWAISASSWASAVMMHAVLKAYRITDRRVWVADSFQGVPPPDAEKYPADRDSDYHTFPDLSVPADEVRRNIGKYGLLDDQIVFLEGWFRDTLPAAPIERLALLRLDGDLYESTIVALNALYEKLSVGGYVIVDDYHVVDGCRAAVSDFRAERGIRSLLSEIDGVGVFWQKTESG